MLTAHHWRLGLGLRLLATEGDTMGQVWVYCAGPLFTEKEKEEMSAIGKALEGEGYKTFLPHRDGLELTDCTARLCALGVPPTEAGALVSEAIFALDVYQVLRHCHVLVANLNGRVPDEGTVSEAAMAWARGKAVVGYKSDSRSVFDGQDNPLVAGLFGFRLCASTLEVAQVVRELTPRAIADDISTEREAELGEHCALGREIWSVMKKSRPRDEIIDEVVDVIAKKSSNGARRACSDAET